jgi:hypothetical protein
MGTSTVCSVVDSDSESLQDMLSVSEWLELSLEDLVISSGGGANEKNG